MIIRVLCIGFYISKTSFLKSGVHITSQVSPFSRTENYLSQIEIFLSHLENYLSQIEIFLSHLENCLSWTVGFSLLFRSSFFEIRLNWS